MNYYQVVLVKRVVYLLKEFTTEEMQRVGCYMLGVVEE